jgi:hypothetical protein
MVSISSSTCQRPGLLATLHFVETHAGPQRPDQLAVVEAIAPFGEVPVEHRHADARGVRFIGELRLRRKARAVADAVAAAGKIAALVPHFV